MNRTRALKTLLPLLLAPFAGYGIIAAFSPLLPPDFLGRYDGDLEAHMLATDARALQILCYRSSGGFDTVSRMLDRCDFESGRTGPWDFGMSDDNVSVVLSGDRKAHFSVSRSSNGKFECAVYVDRGSADALPTGPSEWPVTVNGSPVCRRSYWPYSWLHGLGIGYLDRAPPREQVWEVVAAIEDAVIRGLLPDRFDRVILGTAYAAGNERRPEEAARRLDYCRTYLSFLLNRERNVKELSSLIGELESAIESLRAGQGDD